MASAATNKAKTTKSKAKAASAEPKKKVADIMFERIMERIETGEGLPWLRPFIQPSMNWFRKYEYNGLNKIVLSGGEYMTKRQLEELNEKLTKQGKETYWFERGCKTSMVVYYSERKKLVADPNNLTEYEKTTGSIKEIDGKLYHVRLILNYSNVFNINNIKNKAGEMLPSRIGNEVEEVFTPAEDIIKRYTEATGVKVLVSEKGAYYKGDEDAIYIPRKEYFSDQEAYYRVVFHELAHSTGVKARINRPCYAKYHTGSKERSQEELVAEMCAVLLASEAGFRSEGFKSSEFNDYNSETYISGWVSWMKDNPQELIKGIQAAEKAKAYILNGGKAVNETATVTLDGTKADMSE